MDAKIRELTDKIFNEGVEKGKLEADRLVADAQSKSDEMLNQAKAEAERIIREAEKRSDELKKNVEAELKLYAAQTLDALKASVANSIIRKIVENWTPGNDVVIETADAKGLEEYFASNAKDLLNKGVTINEVAGTATNFVLKPADGSYKIQFGEEELKSFFQSFLRPRLVEMLF